MDKIIKAIEDKINIGYGYHNLEVNFGYLEEGAVQEGYYLSKINGWGSIPITEVLCDEKDVNFKELILMLDELGIAYSI